jgi:hypothetical protein
MIRIALCEALSLYFRKSIPIRAVDAASPAARRHI